MPPTLDVDSDRLDGHGEEDTGAYPPGVGALQDFLCLVSYHFLSQVVEHADTQQDPGEGDGERGEVLNFGTVCQQWLLAAAAVHPSSCQG